MNYLLLVEGAKTEINIFQRVLERYGMKVVSRSQLQSFSDLRDIDLDRIELQGEKGVVLIVQAPRNRLSDLLRYYERADVDLHIAFGGRDTPFNGVFLVFDVDHTSREDLIRMFSTHNDETDKGLLLISSPCIEIMTEPGRTEELKTDHLRKYKHQRNDYISNTLKLGISAEQYISDNFEKLAVDFLDQNRTEFNDTNVMNHPEEVIRLVNERNERTEEEVVYRYFTTVVYVLFACVFGLNVQIDNYDALRDFLISHKTINCCQSVS